MAQECLVEPDEVLYICERSEIKSNMSLFEINYFITLLQ